MKDKNQHIAAILTIATSILFILGVVLWPFMPKVNLLDKLYYVTTSFSLYSLSLVIFIIAKSTWLKAVSCLGLGVFSINLYIELFLDPLHWTRWSIGLIIFVALNLFLIVSITEKLKSKKNERDSSPIF